MICTGNRCRSPLAAQAMTRLAADIPVSVTSYGTLPHEGLPPPPPMLEVAAELGFDLSTHRSRPLGGADLHEADLVIGFEWRHLAAAAAGASARPERCFTLRELVHLLVERAKATSTGAPEEQARQMVAEAHATRSGAQVSVPDGIDDPIGGPRSLYLAVAVEVVRLSSELVHALFPAGSAPRTNGDNDAPNHDPHDLSAIRPLEW